MDQKTTGEAATSQVDFDLLNNPFVLLRVSPTATKEDVAEAFDEAIAEGWADDDTLRDARRRLLAPKLRLAASVDMLVDATPQQRDAAISALRDGLALSELIGLAKDLPDAARLVFLSNIAQLWPGVGALRYSARALAAIDRARFDADVSGLFEQAGLPAPDTASITEAFDAGIQRSVKRLFSGYPDAKSAASDVRRCIDEVASPATDDQLAACSSLITAYQAFAAPAIGDLRRRIIASAENILENTSDVVILEGLEADLRSWDELSQPAQLLAQRKGRDEPQARELYKQLRALMITLANEKNAAQAALKLSKVCMEVFAELPRAASEIKQDLGALQALVDQEGARDLVDFIDKMRANLAPLADELKRGFGSAASGNARHLYQLFDSAVAATKGTEASDLPWAVVRDLALAINNELGDGAASEAIIASLVSHRGFKDASQQMRAAIRADHQVVRMNKAQARFARALDSKDTADARVALETMVDLATEPGERRQYQQAIADLDAARRRGIIRWVFWGMFILFGIIFAASEGSNRRSSTSPSAYRPSTAPSYTPPAQMPAAADDEEVKPAASGTRAYSRGNVRYCQFEGARIDAAGLMLANETNRVIALYNQAVDDFNARCARYAYFADDLTVVQRELAASQARISADARSRLERWRTSN